GYRPVLDAARHNNEFTFVYRYRMVAKLHQQASLDHQKQLVVAFVVMPYKGTKKLDKFHLLAIQFSRNARLPVIADPTELLANVHPLHLISFLILARLL